jgi:hypothetical protein
MVHVKLEAASLLFAALALTACGSGASGQPFAVDAGSGDAVSEADASPEAADADAAACATLVMCDGVCVQAASCAFSVTSVSPAGGPMNGTNFVTVKGHGFAIGMQVLLGDGRAVVDVLDAGTALIQPPPGPHQAVDVTVTLGGAMAVLPLGYRYESGMLGTTLAANSMSVARFEHAAVTLMSGKVLLAGNWATPTAVADLFDPTTNTFAPSTSMLTTPRGATIGVLLVDGRVLLMSNATPSAEIYYPATDQFTAVAGAPVLADDLDQPWPVRLRDGRVLVVKGSGRPCYFFDSDTDTFTMAGAGPQTVFIWNSPMENGVHVLPDGRVAVIGGNQDPIYTPVSTVELFDPRPPPASRPLRTCSRRRAKHPAPRCSATAR